MKLILSRKGFDSAYGKVAILDRLGPGVEVHLSSVWDLKNPSGAIVFQPKAPREH